MEIVFLGRSFGEIVRDKLKEAGYELVDAKSEEFDLLVVAFWGSIVSQAMIQKPRYGALNVHPSLLPKYRGPSPIPTAILNGDEKTGVSIILMDADIDHGPLLMQQEFQISNFKFQNGVGKPTAPELHEVLWNLGGDLLVETIPKWIGGHITLQEQNHSKATYTKKLTREDGRIDWSKPAEYRERQIRAFTPWPGAFTFWKGKRLKVLKAHVEEGTLVIDELQMEGKRATTMREFLLGHPDFVMPPER